MSFILDALKKAESERHRASGPVLVDVRIAPRRRSLPAWAWVLGGVLLVNLVVLIWLLLRKPTIEVAATSPAAPATGIAQPVTPAATPATIPATIVPAAAPSPVPVPVPVPPAQYTPAPVTPPDIASLPTLQDLQTAGVSLPPLLLNLHVYDPSPAQRYVLLNGQRLGEGDFTSDGIMVETITERGAVLEARGRRFLLPAGKN